MALTSRIEVSNKITLDGDLGRIVNNPHGGYDGSIGNTSNAFGTADDIADTLDESKSNGKETNNILRDILNNLKTPSNETSPSSEIFKEKNIVKNNEYSALKNTGDIASSLTGFAQNDTFAAGTNFIKTSSSKLSDLGKEMVESGGSSAGLGKLLGKVGIAGALTSLVLGGVNAFSKRYESALPGIDKLSGSFDTVTDKKGRIISGDDLRESVLSYNKRTGMDANSFVDLTQTMGRYGINDIERGALIAQHAARWARSTNGDVNTMTEIAGITERYGGDGANVFKTLYGASQAQGLSKGQFNEFVSGVQSVLEDGLSKGFIKNAGDIAKQMTNVSLQSGNSEYWKGEEGARHYLSVSNAMASNTSLQSSSNMLLYRAMQKANPEMGWTDIMQKIEAGDWGDEDFMKNYKNVLTNAYGNDKDSIMAAIKENFGTSWKGSSEIYKSIFEGKEINTEKTISESYKDPEVLTDFTKMQEALSSIDNKLTKFGAGQFVDKFNLILNNLGKLLSIGTDKPIELILEE